MLDTEIKVHDGFTTRHGGFYREGHDVGRKEQNLLIQSKLLKKEATKPYADDYNEQVAKMTELKQELLDQELIVEKARQAAIKESEDDKGGCDEKMQTWSRAHAKLEMIQKAIQVATDDTTFYDQVSDLASSGKLMQAAKVVSDHKLKRKQTECEKEFQKKVRRAELSLKREGDADAALLMARQLGASSALMQSPAMHIASQHGFSMGSITSSQPNQFYPPLPPAARTTAIRTAAGAWTVSQQHGARRRGRNTAGRTIRRGTSQCRGTTAHQIQNG